MKFLEEQRRLQESTKIFNISVDFWQDKVMEQIGHCETLESSNKVGSAEHDKAIEELNYLLSKLSFEDRVLADLEKQRIKLMKKKND